MNLMIGDRGASGAGKDVEKGELALGRPAVKARFCGGNE